MLPPLPRLQNQAVDQVEIRQEIPDPFLQSQPGFLKPPALKTRQTRTRLAFSVTGNRTHGFVFAEEPAALRSGEGDGFGGQGGRVNVAAHQNIHLFLRLHLRLLKHERVSGWCKEQALVTERVKRAVILTSWCIRWYTFCSLSSTTKDSDGTASPLKMKLRSPRWHFMSVKSMRVVSNLKDEIHITLT